MSDAEPVCVFCRESLEDTPVELRAEGWMGWSDDVTHEPVRWPIYAHPKCAQWLRPPET